MSNLVKTAKYYLTIVSIIYIILGMETFNGYIAAVSEKLADYLASGYLGLYLVVTPLTYITYNDTSSRLIKTSIPPIILEVVAIFLGILGLVALISMKKSTKWIYIWYSLSSLALLTACYNAYLYFFSKLNPKLYLVIYDLKLFIILGFAHGLLFFLATHTIHRELKRNL